jgi:predicted alpha/beta superfamily hydrolase
MHARSRLSFSLAFLALAACGPSLVEVDFVVHVPASTAYTDIVWVTGSTAELGTWGVRSGTSLARQEDGTYRGSVSLPPDTTAEYMLTRGSWRTIERGPSGEEVPPHALSVGTARKTEEVTVAKWMTSTGQWLTGRLEYLHGLSSTYITYRTLDCIIYLPPGYDEEPARRYPVFYMHDGQNLMDATTSFAGEWGADETAQRLIRAGLIEPIIIVGVYNGGTSRIAEYTPVADPEYGGGNADAYGSFLIQELKPLIDSTYRTKPEAQYTGLAGSSLGGLVSMYFGLTHSDVFRKLGVVSPSVWWANNDIVTRVNGISAKLPLEIWEDIGTAEGSEETVGDARLLRDALVAKGWVLDEDLKYLEVEMAGHSEGAWSARFDQILQYLYPPQG